jgi:hypothetical protein
MDFLSSFTQYDIVMIVDDMSGNYADRDNIQFVQIREEDCKREGIIDVNALSFDRITGWEKAVYYFTVVNTSHQHVWFLEDDVFFHSEETIMKIDTKYPHSDLLSAPYTEKTCNNWHWRRLKIQCPPPYFHAMACAVRMSRNLLSRIREYASQYKTLFFLEALFPTLCKGSGLVYDTPSEMQNIIHMGRYQKENIDADNLYHPVKDLNKHVAFRS